MVFRLTLHSNSGLSATRTSERRKAPPSNRKCGRVVLWGRRLGASGAGTTRRAGRFAERIESSGDGANALGYEHSSLQQSRHLRIQGPQSGVGDARTLTLGVRRTRRFPVIALVLSVAAVLIPTTSAGLTASQAFDRSGAVSAGASGVWDPDDVTGRFDLRWVGAAYTSTDEIHLSFSFYDGFKRRFLPREIDDRYSHVSVGLGTVDGWFLRQQGRIVFIWGDFGSSCCEHARVRQTSSNALSVVFDPCSYVYGNEIDQAQGESYWRPRETRANDVTGVVHLAHPNCDS